MNRAIIAVVLSLCVISCRSNKTYDAWFKSLAPKQIRSEEHPFARGEAKSLFEKLEEPSMLELAKDPSQRVYRLTWLRSFHDPMTFRLVLAPTNPPVLIVKQLKREIVDETRVELRGLIRNETLVLTSNQFWTVERFLNGANFWTLPTSDPRPSGLDGAEWTLEGIENGRYHVTTRNDPLPPYCNQSDLEGLSEETARSIRTKHSDEVGMDMFSLYLIFLGRSYDEAIY